MSYLQTLTALAGGFAMTRGVDRASRMGGMDGIRQAMAANPALAANPLMQQALQGFENFGSAALQGGEAARQGMAQLMASLGGAAAGGATQAAAMLDQLTGTTAATATMEDNARLMIRAMVMAAKADGGIDETERARLEAALADASPAERAFVAAEMDAPVDVLALAEDAQGAARTQVYSAAAGMVKGDNPAAAQYLAALGGALQLDLTTRQAIHAALGLPAPAA